MSVLDYQSTISDFIGFAGALIIVFQYYRGISGRANVEGLAFPLINLCGCALVLYSLYHNFNPPSFVIEIFWSAVSMYGIVKALLKSKSAS